MLLSSFHSMFSTLLMLGRSSNEHDQHEDSSNCIVAGETTLSALSSLQLRRRTAPFHFLHAKKLPFSSRDGLGRFASRLFFQTSLTKPAISILPYALLKDIISHTTTPKLYTSHNSLYGWFIPTSGAICGRKQPSNAYSKIEKGQKPRNNYRPIDRQKLT
jgi:hypothetical protein